MHTYSQGAPLSHHENVYVCRHIHYLYLYKRSTTRISHDGVYVCCVALEEADSQTLMSRYLWTTGLSDSGDVMSRCVVTTAHCMVQGQRLNDGHAGLQPFC